MRRDDWRAHTRARGIAIEIAYACLGGGDGFDRAIADFSEAYADQNEQDFEAFSGAADSGRDRGSGRPVNVRKEGLAGGTPRMVTEAPRSKGPVARGRHHLPLGCPRPTPNRSSGGER